MRSTQIDKGFDETIIFVENLHMHIVENCIICCVLCVFARNIVIIGTRAAQLCKPATVCGHEALLLFSKL